MSSANSRVVRSGNSEAVRLPKSVAFGREVEVTIIRSGDILTIFPKKPPTSELFKQLEIDAVHSLLPVIAVDRPDSADLELNRNAVRGLPLPAELVDEPIRQVLAGLVDGREAADVPHCWAPSALVTRGASSAHLP